MDASFVSPLSLSCVHVFPSPHLLINRTAKRPNVFPYGRTTSPHTISCRETFSTLFFAAMPHRCPSLMEAYSHGCGLPVICTTLSVCVKNIFLCSQNGPSGSIPMTSGRSTTTRKASFPRCVNVEAEVRLYTRAVRCGGLHKSHHRAFCHLWPNWE